MLSPAGLKTAAAIRKEGALSGFVKERYASWDSGIGKEIEAGKLNFVRLKQYMIEKGEPAPEQLGSGGDAGETC
jgi:xylose isomerase